MLEKLEELLENDLLRYIITGCSVSFGVAMAVFALVTLFATFVSSVWWAVAFIISTIIAGGAIGVSLYLYAGF